MAMTMPRLSYQQSCDKLRAAGWCDAADPLPMPAAMPRHDDDLPLGVCFFRTCVERSNGNDLSGLTLPRTYIARSTVGPVSFANTDLSESCLCWNDFEDADFTGANLSRADLRASNFTRVRFVGATLTGADLRHSTFVDCDFDGAELTAAKLARHGPGLGPPLSREQAASVDWRPDVGPVPDGG